MYRCAISGKVSKSGEPAYKVVLETRPKTYFKKDIKTGEPRKVGEGFEIVKEVIVCRSVYEKMTKEK